MASFVYFVVNDFDKEVKIGVTGKDIASRIRELQTGNPKELKLMGFLMYPTRKKCFEAEKMLHEKYKANHIRGEWFDLESYDVYDELKRHYNAYLALSEDSLMTVGFDIRGEAIGELWDWDDNLSWEECCPSCGSLYGLSYNEEYLLHECFQCGYQLIYDDSEYGL